MGKRMVMMTSNRTWRFLLGLALISGLLALTAGAVWAFPPVPQYFYGTAKTTTGAALPQGTLVVARAVTGPWTGSATTTVDSQGRYGYNPVLQVVGDDPGTPEIEGPRPGNQIALFVDGIRASLYNPATDATTLSYPYTSGESTRLDLRESYVIRLPLIMNSAVGDGVGE